MTVPLTYLLLLLRLPLVVYPSDVIFHVVHARKDPATFLSLGTTPFTLDPRVVLGLVPRPVLFAAEATGEWLISGFCAAGSCCLTLGTAIHATEQMFAMTIVMLTKVTAASKCSTRSATGIGTSPGLALRARLGA